MIVTVQGLCRMCTLVARNLEGHFRILPTTPREKCSFKHFSMNSRGSLFCNFLHGTECLLLSLLGLDTF